ncbi:MAG: hypothetical protein ACREOQ_14505, partial [Gemmatimonadales bacterium]
MRALIFGLSTTPVMDIKSALRLQLERDLLALVYRSPPARAAHRHGLTRGTGAVPRGRSERYRKSCTGVATPFSRPSRHTAREKT